MAADLTNRSRNQLLYRLFYWGVLFILAAGIFGIFLKDRFNIYERALLGDMVYGQAHRPFVYRVLLPGLTRVLLGVIPENLAVSARHTLIKNQLIYKFFVALHWDPAYALEHLLAAVLMYLSLIGFVLAFRYLFITMYISSPIVADISSLVALGMLPALFYRVNYIYDFPALLLFTLGLAYMARLSWFRFMLVFILANLNKETAILLTMVFVLHFMRTIGKSDKKLYFGLLSLQLSIFAIIRQSLWLIYNNNPGGLVEFHLIDHNLGLIRPYSLSTLVALAAVILLVIRDWRQKPGFLRDGIVILIPLAFLTLFFGFFDELRDYYEAYPILLLLMLPSIFEIVKVKITSRQPLYMSSS